MARKQKEKILRLSGIPEVEDRKGTHEGIRKRMLTQTGFWSKQLQKPSNVQLLE